MSQSTNQALNDWMENLPPEIRIRLLEKMNSIANYTPRVGIMGKSGAGKSSLANAIVGKQVFEVGHLGGCTRNLQEEVVQIKNRELAFVDLPGIAENPERHDEYLKLYEEQLPKLDIILWVIKVDDRAQKDDLQFYQWLTQRYKKEQIIFVLSQCDKTHPTKEWDWDSFKPDKRQQETISEKLKLIAQDFSISSYSNIVSIAYDYDEEEGKARNYNLHLLAEYIIHNMPSQAKSSFYASLAGGVKTEKAKEEALDGFLGFVDETLDDIIDSTPLPKVIKEPAKKAKTALLKGAKKLWGKLFD